MPAAPERASRRSNVVEIAEFIGRENVNPHRRERGLTLDPDGR
jgi:hypothetical protein